MHPLYKKVTQAVAGIPDDRLDATTVEVKAAPVLLNRLDARPSELELIRILWVTPRKLWNQLTSKYTQKRLKVSRARMCQIYQALESKGYIERKIGPKGIQYPSLTDKTLEILYGREEP